MAIKKARGIWLNSFTIREIPVIPPSIKELGIKKLSRPILADNAPRVRLKRLRTSLFLLKEESSFVMLTLGILLEG